MANTNKSTAVKAGKSTTAVKATRQPTFTDTQIVCEGKALEARYSVSATKGVYVFSAVTVGGIVTPIRLHITPDMPTYKAALDAATAAKAETKPATQAEPKAPEAKTESETPAKAEPKAPKAKTAKPTTSKAPAAKAPEAKPTETPAKAEPKAPKAKTAKPTTSKASKAKAPAAEDKAVKPAAKAEPKAPEAKGDAIVGDGWRFVFDEQADRTRLIFDAEPTAAQRSAIDAAGFYWSPSMKSFNKKLTKKAMRKAVELADVLKGIAA